MESLSLKALEITFENEYCVLMEIIRQGVTHITGLIMEATP